MVEERQDDIDQGDAVLNLLRGADLLDAEPTEAPALPSLLRRHPDHLRLDAKLAEALDRDLGIAELRIILHAFVDKRSPDAAFLGGHGVGSDEDIDLLFERDLGLVALGSAPPRLLGDHAG